MIKSYEAWLRKNNVENYQDFVNVIQETKREHTAYSICGEVFVKMINDRRRSKGLTLCSKLIQLSEKQIVFYYNQFAEQIRFVTPQNYVAGVVDGKTNMCYGTEFKRLVKYCNEFLASSENEEK